ncbi:MAG: hypothetical protein K2H77_02110, partial [Alistipes sp.]|nr:hypothetical protein [Alistipes sp.]
MTAGVVLFFAQSFAGSAAHRAAALPADTLAPTATPRTEAAPVAQKPDEPSPAAAGDSALRFPGSRPADPASARRERRAAREEARRRERFNA